MRGSPQKDVREQWVETLVRHGKDSSAAHRAVDKVPVGHHLIASRTSVQVSVDRHTPPTDALLLSVPAPTIPPDSHIHLKTRYNDICHDIYQRYYDIF